MSLGDALARALGRCQSPMTRPNPRAVETVLRRVCGYSLREAKALMHDGYRDLYLTADESRAVEALAADLRAARKDRT